MHSILCGRGDGGPNMMQSCTSWERLSGRAVTLRDLHQLQLLIVMLSTTYLHVTMTEQAPHINSVQQVILHSAHPSSILAIGKWWYPLCGHPEWQNLYASYCCQTSPTVLCITSSCDLNFYPGALLQLHKHNFKAQPYDNVTSQASLTIDSWSQYVYMFNFLKAILCLSKIVVRVVHSQMCSFYKTLMRIFSSLQENKYLAPLGRGGCWVFLVSVWGLLTAVTSKNVVVVLEYTC
jgi:hypothetical protein